MVRLGALCRVVACAAALLLSAAEAESALGDAQLGKMGKMGKAGLVPRPKPNQHLPENCRATFSKGGRPQSTKLVDNGFDEILLVVGDECNFKDGPPSDGALVCFLYAFLLTMPVLYFLSVHIHTSEYTWVFLDSFMGIFIAILWWSCFQDWFDTLTFPERIGFFVVVRCVVVPGFLFLIADSADLFGVAGILKHVCAFIAVSTGTEALKFFNDDKTPDNFTLIATCAGAVAFNMGIWKVKCMFAETYLKETDKKKVDRWEEVTTELGLDVTATCLAAMLFLTLNLLRFRDGDLMKKDANLSMGNTHLFDNSEEGWFAAIYCFFMCFITLGLEKRGGPEHSHNANKEVPATAKEGDILKYQHTGTVSGEKGVTLQERVVVRPKETASDPRVTVELVSPSVFDDRSAEHLKVNLSDLQVLEEENWKDYLYHLMQLSLATSASWSGLLATCYLVRGHWFPFLLERHLEGSLFVSVLLMFFAGIVIAVLSAHSKDKFLSNNIMRYFRMYFLRAVSLMAALSWDMTFDAAVEDLPMDVLVSEDHEFAGKIAVAFVVSFIVAPIYVFGMRPSIAAAIALVEHREKEDVHAKTE